MEGLLILGIVKTQKWAEHWIREEGERARERMLKG